MLSLSPCSPLRKPPTTQSHFKFLCQGGASREAAFALEKKEGAVSTLALVDEVLHLVCGVLSRSSPPPWVATAQQLCCASLGGALEALQECFPLLEVAKRAAVLVKALPTQHRTPNRKETVGYFDARGAANELALLRRLACHRPTTGSAIRNYSVQV